jgi:hypothetical protein
LYQANDYLEAYWAYQSFRTIFAKLESDFYKQVLAKIQERFNIDEEKDVLPIINEIYQEYEKKKLQFPKIKF